MLPKLIYKLIMRCYRCKRRRCISGIIGIKNHVKASLNESNYFGSRLENGHSHKTRALICTGKRIRETTMDGHSQS